jgi:hypothetical protein
MPRHASKSNDAKRDDLIFKSVGADANKDRGHQAGARCMK